MNIYLLKKPDIPTAGPLIAEISGLEKSTKAFTNSLV
jgi:hypothetical protein